MAVSPSCNGGGNLAGGDGDEDHVVLDRVENLVGEHAAVTIPYAVSLGELGANVRALVALGSEQNATRHAETHRDLVHEVLDEAGEGGRGAGGHHLHLVGGVEVFDHAHVRELVLALLAVLEGGGRHRREGLAWRGAAALVKHQSGLLASEAHADLLGIEDALEHAGRVDDGVKLGDSAVLVAAEWVEIMAEGASRNVLGVDV